jgi:hypothetical protein
MTTASSPSVTLVGDAGPDIDDLVVALAVGDEALLGTGR